MCGGFHGPMGIPITKDLHEQLPEETKKAFETFHAWFTDQERPKRTDMPDEVAKALATIKETPIPGYEGHTCAESCYVRGVEMQLA
jgi:hypothetical protein